MCLQLEARPKAAPAQGEPAFTTYGEITTFFRLFKTTRLPREQWTHAAHLVAALVYLRTHAPRDAFERLRAAIVRYNEATGTPSTPTRGYHETITRAWFHLVRHFLDVFDDGRRSLPELASALVTLYASSRELSRHYSRERLLCPEAKAGWLEPDLMPLPALEEWTPGDRNWLQKLALRAPAPVAVELTV